MSVMTIDDAEEYGRALAGVNLEAVQTGAGDRPTKVLRAATDRFAFTRSTFGFPMLTRAAIPDNAVAIAYVKSVSPRCRWCEIDVEPGQVLLYGPEAPHTARNLPGLDVMFAVVDQQRIEAYAAQIGCRITPPRRGRINVLANPPKSALIAQTYPAFADLAASGRHPSTACCDDVLRAVTRAVSIDEDVVRVVGASPRIDSRAVVHDCIDYAEALGRIPAISELCLAAHVSERRLRTAFEEEYGVAPTRYFKAWALEEAHRLLTHPRAGSATVTEVAVSLGFDHLGRFAGEYRRQFGERPSETLHASIA